MGVFAVSKLRDSLNAWIDTGALPLNDAIGKAWSRSEPSAWWVVAPLVVGAVLRLYHLPAESIWFDEAVSIRQARLPFWEMIGETAYDNNPPLHNIALFLSLRLFGVIEPGTTAFAARLPSVGFDLATIGLVFLIGRQLFSSSTGLIAAWLVTFSPFHIAYAQEARMYAALTFGATLSVFTLVLYLERHSIGARVGYVLATALLLYTHPYAVFVVGAENLFVLYLLLKYRTGAVQRLIDWIVLQLAVLALFAPWLPTLVARTTKIQENFWIAAPSLDVLNSTLRIIAGGQMALILGLLAFIGIAWTVPSPVRPQGPTASRHEATSLALGYWDKVGLLAVWFVMPVLVPFLLSLLLQPFFLSRYTIGASPAWQVAVALGLNNCSRARMLPAAGLTALFLAAMGPETMKAYRSPWAADWRSAVAYLEKHVPSHGHVLLPAYWERRPYLFYATRSDIELLPYSQETALPDDDQTWIVSSRHINFCDAHAETRHRLGTLVEKRRFYNISVCHFHKTSSWKTPATSAPPNVQR